MKYRTDRYETNEHGQSIGYVDWIGGPTISRVQAVCPDGLTRWAHVTGEPDTWFSLPAYVNNGGQGRITGWIGTDEGVWHFHPYTCQLPITWRPTKASRAN
jgi:hypothetical protein